MQKATNNYKRIKNILIKYAIPESRLFDFGLVTTYGDVGLGSYCLGLLPDGNKP